jgi:hypothetical protein
MHIFPLVSFFIHTVLNILSGMLWWLMWAAGWWLPPRCHLWVVDVCFYLNYYLFTIFLVKTLYFIWQLYFSPRFYIIRSLLYCIYREIYSFVIYFSDNPHILCRSIFKSKEFLFEIVGIFRPLLHLYFWSNLKEYS